MRPPNTQETYMSGNRIRIYIIEIDDKGTCLRSKTRTFFKTPYEKAVQSIHKMLSDVPGERNYGPGTGRPYGYTKRGSLVRRAILNLGHTFTCPEIYNYIAGLSDYPQKVSRQSIHQHIDQLVKRGAVVRIGGWPIRFLISEASDLRAQG